MQRFDYEVLAADGSVLTGALEARSEAEALRMLERKGLQPLALQAHLPSRTRGRRGSLRETDVILALHELATMLQSGVAVAEAVRAQTVSGHHPRLLDGFESISRELVRGHRFADALAGSGIPLPAYVLQLAQAGEMTGQLGESLADAVRQMEYAHASASEIRNALVYPSILVAAGIAAVALMFVFVVPRFSGLLDRAGEMPLLAWAVLAGGQWVNANAGWLLALAVAAAVASVPAWRSPRMRLAALDLVARTPVLGTWLLQAEIARWANVMAALVGQRVPLLQSLELAAQGVRFPQRRQRLAQVGRLVRNGLPLSDALQEQDALDATGYNLIRVGERSGELAAMLGSLGRLYDEAGRKRMKRALALIEPIAILLIGSVIGTIILAVILAITSANDLAF